MTLLLSSYVAIDEDKLIASIKSHFGKKVQIRRFYKHLTDFEHGETLFVVATDEELKVWLANIRHKDLTIYIIANSQNPLATAFFNLPYNLNELFALRQFSSYLTFINNEEVVLDTATIGYEVKNSLFKKITLFKTTLVYGDQKLTTAALKIESANERIFSQKGYALFEKECCDRSGALIYSPKSIIDLVKFHFFQKRATLPDGIGIIKSQHITIESENPIPVFIDGRQSIQKRIIVKTHKTPLRIATGHEVCQASQKDFVRTDNLIKEEELIDFFTKKSLPFLPIATEEAFAQLFKKIRQNAKISATYLTLLVLSVLMATLGLFQNSAPTIIGAMILAPLMAPLISLSMGVIRFEKNLFIQSFKTLAFSVVLALLLSAGMTLLFPYHHLTDQMALRTHPTLLDLGVAILSGIAAAYGYANSKVGESLAGVAIAVALVPPLCVAGIGLGWGEVKIFWQAFLLFLANIVGIAFAAGVMFYLLGYASRKYVSAAFILKFFIILTIALPLYLSTLAFIEQERVYNVLESIKLSNVQIEIVRVTPKSVEVKIAAKDQKSFENAIMILKQKLKTKQLIAIYERVVE